jgi:hypothetical protein
MQVRPFYLTLAALLGLETTVLGSGGMVDQSIDALFNLRDQLQGVVMKSVRGVGEAMREGPPPEGPGEGTLAYLQRMHHEYSELHMMDKNLLHAQRRLQQVDLQILAHLPPQDPRRHQIAAEIKHLGVQARATEQSMERYGAKAAQFREALQRYHQRHG